MTVDPGALFAALPKAELHLHIEGTLEPETLLALAHRYAFPPPFPSATAAHAAYTFSNLQDFLTLYYNNISVLITEQDFYDLALSYLKRAQGDMVRHVEIFFDPQAHVERGVSFATVFNGLHRALREGEPRLDISSPLILCFLRDRSETSAFAILEQAQPFLGQIAGVGLDSAEHGNPPEKFERGFARARSLGLEAVAHAGEGGPPAYVTAALDTLRVSRIDHGNRALEDTALTARLVREQTPLTICPLSNLRLRGVPEMARHPLPRMLRYGLKVSVNSDDPAYSGGYINDNFDAVHAAQPLTTADAILLATNSFSGSFLSAEQKRFWVDRITEQARAAENHHV